MLYESGRVTLQLGDCFEVLETLADGSVDAFITDPPYGNTNCAFDGKFDLARWWNLIEQKLKPNGVVVAFACGRFVFELYASKPKWFRYDLVWEKSNAVGFLDANVRPLRSHEWVLIFAPKLKGTTYNPQKWRSEKARIGATSTASFNTEIYSKVVRTPWVDDGTRYPRSVLHFNSVGNGSRHKQKHPTQKPLDLITYLVKTYTNEGELVVDPFLGSGTTAEACLLTGRRFFGCERDEKYFGMAQRRIERLEGGIAFDDLDGSGAARLVTA